MSHKREHFEPMGLPQIASRRDFDMKRVNWADIDILRRDIRKQIDEVPSYQNPTTPPTSNNP